MRLIKNFRKFIQKDKDEDKDKILFCQFPKKKKERELFNRLKRARRPSKGGNSMSIIR